MRSAAIFILFLFSCLNGFSQDIIISARFDSTRILIGDQIHFIVSVEQPADINLEIPAFRDTIIKNIEVLAGPDTDSSSLDENRIRITEKYLITSFDSGLYKVDPLFVEVKGDQGLKRYYSDYAELEVMKYRVAPTDSTTKIYDIIEPFGAPVTFREIIPWALAGIAVAALLWGLIVLIKKLRKQKPGEEKMIEPDPAHVIAFRELERLKGEELWQKGLYKQYYTRITEVLRQYLENRYVVLSLELTTSETLQALLSAGFKKGSDYENLRSVLVTADLVKFAKYIPSPEDNTSAFDRSWEFIESTKKVALIPEQPINMDKSEEEEI